MTTTAVDSQRIDYTRITPAYEAMLTMHATVNRSALDRRLIELIRIRASQLNGCAFCLDMHAASAVRAGESDARLTVVAGWREAGVFDDRERAALALTEAVTSLHRGVPEDVLAAAEEVFDADELAAVLFAAVEINAWNRLNVASRKPLTKLSR